VGDNTYTNQSSPR